eukprot:scaffold93266_cov59-Phaeocystis_antarctica.AAC.1
MAPGRAMPARGAGAAARTVRGTCIHRTATHATGEGHTHWHACGEGQRARGGARNPLQKSSSHLSPGKRCGNGAERPRLVQTQCRCPRDVRRFSSPASTSDRSSCGWAVISRKAGSEISARRHRVTLMWHERQGIYFIVPLQRRQAR